MVFYAKQSRNRRGEKKEKESASRMLDARSTCPLTWRCQPLANRTLPPCLQMGMVVSLHADADGGGTKG